MKRVKDRSRQVSFFFFVGRFVAHMKFLPAVLQREPKPTNFEVLCALCCCSSPVVKLFRELPDPQDDATAAAG